ncbi:hypothetical protein [Flectobacillus rivi]|uniref:Uncharacterized protein n=1 Tax=Flectobacillus rivi TaxID=2984209 RepID=A0ABT6YYC0_9BACT|nr:hypothetical protein [Flectobacillus rivi]MDI9873870.1 hypothetical protein [Flectobacillus rivi]
MEHEKYFLYFSREVLNFYRVNSHIYNLKEDDMGGEIQVSDSWNESMNSVYPCIQLKFAFRKLENEHMCVAVFMPLFDERVSEENYRKWNAFRIENPIFHEINNGFDRWVNRYINGSWKIENGPKIKIEKELRLINSLSKIKFGRNLFKHEEYILVNYPVAENNVEYTKSVLELYRLVIDGMEKECIVQISEFLNIELNDKTKRLNCVKELLEDDLVEKIHSPLNSLSKKRMPIHGIPSQGVVPFPAFESFNNDLKDIYQALFELRSWLEDKLNLDSELCRKRLESFLNFPKLDKPPRPEFKLLEVQRMIGKTIQRIEFGEISSNENVHQSEALNIYFSDGTAMTVQIGSNAGIVASEYEGMKPSDFHTDIMIFWAEELKNKNELPR